MKKHTAKKSDLLKFIKGHQRANELIKEEKRVCLPMLAEEQSRAEYNSLCNLWEKNPNKKGMNKLERRKVAFLVERRKKFDVMGGLCRK